MSNKLTAYTPQYKESCFQVWYSLGRPKNLKACMDKFPPDEYGRKPTSKFLNVWKKQLGWDAKADTLDNKAMVIVENDLVTRKAEMLRKQAAVGFDLQQMGMEHLKAHGFDSASSAVNAVIRGAELERSSRGIGELMVRMATMTDAELEQEIIKELNRAADSGQIVDGDVEELDKSEESTDNTSTE